VQVIPEVAELEIKVGLSLPRDAASVPVSRQLLDSCLGTLGVTPDTRADIALALSEACANVIRHAGPGREYEVQARTRDGRCIIEVLDTGDANRTQRAADATVTPAAADSLLAEGGRGLKIIDAVVDDLSLTGNSENGTTVHFEKVLEFLPGASAAHLSGPAAS
jgi:serine/threonine-protein kinase RsbW